MPSPFSVPRSIDSTRAPVKASDRAVLALSSWSDACSIPWQKSSLKDGDIAIIDTAGNPHEITIIVKPGQTIEKGTFAVAGYDLTSPNREVAFGAFHSITEAFGHGSPIPVDRGADPDQKLCYKDDMELVAMRHGLLRLSPNLKPESVAVYESVIDNCTRSYANKFKRFFDLFGYKQSDLATYSHMWFLIWHHHYRKLFATVDENKKLLTRYIKQSFINFGTTVQSKANGCFPEGESVQVALYEDSIGKPLIKNPRSKDSGGESIAPIVPFSINHDYDHGPDSSEDLNYQKAHNLLDKSDEKKRRKSAAKILADNLAKLPHDQLIGVLQGASENEAFEYDARMEARRQLRKHIDVCLVCPKEDKNVSGGDTASD